MDGGRLGGIIFASIAVIGVIAKMRYRVQPTRRQFVVLGIALASCCVAVLLSGAPSFLAGIAAFIALLFSGDQVANEPGGDYVYMRRNDLWSGGPSQGDVLEQKYEDSKLGGFDGVGNAIKPREEA